MSEVGGLAGSPVWPHVQRTEGDTEQTCLEVSPGDGGGAPSSLLHARQSAVSTQVHLALQCHSALTYSRPFTGLTLKTKPETKHN